MIRSGKTAADAPGALGSSEDVSAKTEARLPRPEVVVGLLGSSTSRRPGPSRVAALMVALAALGCSNAPHQSSPHAAAVASRPAVAPVRVVNHTYVIPRAGTAGRPGALSAASDLGPDRLIADADRWTLLYHSSNLAGRDVVVSGALLIPRGRSPARGWPVVSWGHGTTGLADRCAPSQQENLFYDEYAQEARSFIHAGYAVVATDYPGLGTPGVHTYLIGVDEGNAMADIVTAAQHIVPNLAGDWFAVGHSQGGQAVLFASRAAHNDRRLHLRATVAIAPASHLDVILPAVLSGNDPYDLSYALYSLIGLSGVDRSVHVSALVAPAGRARLPLITDKECLDQTDAAFNSVTPQDVFRISADESRRLNAKLGVAANPDNARVEGPVLVIQGAEDQDVPAGITAAMVQHLRHLHSDITERVYPKLNHDGVLGPSSCDVLAWLTRHGGPAMRACRPQPSAP